MTEQSGAERVVAELERRIGACRDSRELVVDFYRIGYRYSFEIPVRERPHRFPAGVLGNDRRYPWLIWVGWELEERLGVLALAARGGDPDTGLTVPRASWAEALLRDELLALGQWSSFDPDDGGAGLITASLAAICADVIEHADQHGGDTTRAALAVARRILEESIAPWFTQTWAEVDPFDPPPDLGMERLFQNIRCITLFRAAQVAGAAGHELADRLQHKASAVYTAWLAARAEPEPMTEGIAYDGFLLQSVLAWVEGRADAGELRHEGRAVLGDIPQAWIRHTAPGRADLLAPIGDVEPQMMHWSSVLLRLARWYDRLEEVAAWFQALPVSRLLADSLSDASVCGVQEAPAAMNHVDGDIQPATAVSRTGYSASDVAVVVSASRTPAPHLHHDGGHLTLGWQDRWWITDPGYQQYRLGDERDFTLGAQAHNAPVLDGAAQASRAVRPQARELQADRGITLDLTGCYAGLPPAARVTREVHLEHGAVLVVDRFTGLPGTRVDTHWHADAGLAWSFVDGAARLSDGQHALWVVTGQGAGPVSLDAGRLIRHAGTRGQLRLDHRSEIQQERALRWWAFIPDPGGAWQRPVRRLEDLIAHLSLDTSSVGS